MKCDQVTLDRGTMQLAQEFVEAACLISGSGDNEMDSHMWPVRFLLSHENPCFGTSRDTRVSLPSFLPPSLREHRL